MTNSNGEAKKQTFAAPFDWAAEIQASARAILEESLALYLKLVDKLDVALILDAPGLCELCRRERLPEQPITYTGGRPDTLTTSPSIPLVAAELTSREVEVLRLLATGKSNREIAAELVLSIRTAERHIANIYEKLGVRGKTARAAATAFAFSHGLISYPTNGGTHEIRISQSDDG